jgi:hypothetical protein
LLDGPGEAEAFENKEFVKLHQSTLRKVDTLATIINRVIDGNLHTNSTWKDRHGIQPSIIGEYIVKHWVFALVTSIIGTISAVYGFFF